MRPSMHLQQFTTPHHCAAPPSSLASLPRPLRPHKRTYVACQDGVPAGAAAIVTQLLDKVAGTDGGIKIQQQQRREADSLISQLEQIGRTQQPPPLSNPLLFGNYNVAYTSSGDDQRGQPAGGRFRGSIGRVLFRTTGVFQSVLEPDVATNKVGFKLFGVLPGSVGLRGKIMPVEAGQPHGRGVAGEGDTVKVLFEPPVLSLCNALHFRIGPSSSVQLSTTYLDERVRLGKGSRGSLFVFTRGGAADEAGMDKVGMETSTKWGLAWLAAAFAAMLAGGWSLWSTGLLGLKVAAACMWLLAALFTAVLQQGGIVRTADDIRQVQQMMQQLQREKEAKEAAAKHAAAVQGQEQSEAAGRPAVAADGNLVPGAVAAA